ncbi:unannotated protein [freshwater metagenome]|uniref:Unannotated protein n=1 Tax=freshwater metagenome TaxID=449393 RepID=A0A6J6ILP3_9ZZZZ
MVERDAHIGALQPVAALGVRDPLLDKMNPRIEKSEFARPTLGDIDEWHLPHRRSRMWSGKKGCNHPFVGGQRHSFDKRYRIEP